VKRFHLFFAFCLLLFSSCVPADEVWGGSTPLGLPGLPTLIPTLEPPTATPATAPTATATPEPQQPSLYLSPAVPPALRAFAQEWGYPLAATQMEAAIHLDVQTGTIGGGLPSTTWIYALVAPFFTVTDEVAIADIRNCWAGEPSGPFAGLPLWMDGSTLTAFTATWGAPVAGSVQVADADELVDKAWNESPAWGIIPFEALEPRWKVLEVDGQSPIHKDFDPATYPLKVTFSLETSLSSENFSLPASNRDPEKMTTLVMTGVTALVRATAYAMEKNGYLWPAEDIRDWLVTTDLTHISNEVPFAQGCPYPDPNYGMLRFCSNELYMTLLDYVGTDIVELTGNHFQDWGSEATLFTLDLYNQAGWRYYGGGVDLEDARKAITLEHNGNRLAFIGCNSAGPAYAWATESQPGAAQCDFEWMQAEVARLEDEGYLVIVTFQHDEYYSTAIPNAQKEDFRPMAEAGAVVVNGSQSHVPMGMEFYSGAFIHYGLGNLFFDQMAELSTRREFIDRHVFYDGSYITTELLTAMLEGYARPRPMTAGERVEMLNLMFENSIWKP